MRFEWERRKADANTKKHGISFDEAATVFGDPLALTFADPDHSEEEERFLTFGVSGSGKFIIVSHTLREPGSHNQCSAHDAFRACYL